MVLYGVVWCGMVWYGVVWYGVVRDGVVWCGVMWWVAAVLEENAFSQRAFVFSPQIYVGI